MTRVSAVAALCVLTTVAPVPARAEQRVADTVTVDGGRPLAKALEILEQRLGVVITYEDPPYESSADIDDVTAIVRRDTDPSKPRVFVPRGGRLTFLNPPERTGGRPAEADVARVVSIQNASGNGGEFRLIAQDGVLHVVPSKSLNAVGTPTDRRSRLEVPVTLDTAERTLFQTIDLILRTVSAASGDRVTIGTAPLNVLLGTKVSIGAKDERARDVLLRGLAATGLPFSWQLYCQPRERLCALNLHVVSATR